MSTVKRTVRVQISVEVQDGSNVENQDSMCEWHEDVSEISYALNVALLALEALRHCLRRQGRY